MKQSLSEKNSKRERAVGSSLVKVAIFPPSSHNNHGRKVAAKAAALIEETVSSCVAAAYT